MSPNISKMELPREILLRIFNFLGPEKLHSCLSICKEWKEIIEVHIYGNPKILRRRQVTFRKELRNRLYELNRAIPHLSNDQPIPKRLMKLLQSKEQSKFLNTGFKGRSLRIEDLSRQFFVAVRSCIS